MKTVPFRLLAYGPLLPLLAFGGEGDEMLANYLELKTLEIEDSFLGEIGNRQDWNVRPPWGGGMNTGKDTRLYALVQPVFKNQNPPPLIDKRRYSNPNLVPISHRAYDYGQAGERTRVVLCQPEAKALGFGPKAISLRKSMPGD